MELKLTPPRVWKDVRLLPPELAKWCQDAADWHYEHGGAADEAELSTDHYPICASPDDVNPHTDEFGGAEIGKMVFGLVVRSDNHVLHSDLLEAQGRSIPLNAGDVYTLHPHDRHWTKGEGQIIFLATFLLASDPRFNKPSKIAHDLQWECLKGKIDAERAIQTAMVQERYRYRGIEIDGLQPVAPDAD